MMNLQDLASEEWMYAAEWWNGVRGTTSGYYQV